MSKMQDVPLAGEQESPPPQADGESLKSKTNSLKRFFKISRKGHVLQKSEDMDETSREAAEEGGGNNSKEKRFGSRLGPAHKSENLIGSTVPSSSTNELNTSGSSKGAALKASISNYWHSIFKRQSSMNATKMENSGAEPSSAGRPATNRFETTTSVIADGATATPVAMTTSVGRETNREVMQNLDEIQTLSISDDSEETGMPLSPPSPAEQEPLQN